jgi:hypothetical protein
VLQQPLEPAAHRGQPPLQALGRQAAPVLGGDEGAQLIGLQGLDGVDAVVFRPGDECFEVAFVGVERVRRHAALEL